MSVEYQIYLLYSIEMNCQCYVNKKQKQTCGVLNDGYLYKCSTENCNYGLGCTSYIDPYDTVDPDNSIFEPPMIYLIIIVMLILGAVLSFSEA